MKKLLVPILCLLIGAAAGSFFTLKSCGPDESYWVERAIYDRDVRVQGQRVKDAMSFVAEQAAIIAEKDAEIKNILAESGKPTPAERVKDAEIAALETRVAELEALGDLPGALAASKAENAAWAEKFNLAEGRHLDSISALNNAWRVKFDAQVVISDAGWTAYNREHALRLTSDSLRIGLEKKLYGGKFWKWLALGEPIVFGAIAIFGK